MDFAWSDTQREIQRAARHAAGTASDPEDGWRACALLGLLGACLPRSVGGAELDLVTTARAIEGYGEGGGDMGLMLSVGAHLLACARPIAAAGGDAARRRFLPPLAAGDWVGANAITEADAGSDVLAMRTRAVRRRDGYAIDGTKTYVTNGPAADVAVVYAITDPAAGPLAASAFAVELDSPGVARGEQHATVGLGAAQLGTLHFDDCFVPAAHRLGGEGQGLLVFEAAMREERACLFAAYVGAMQRQLDTVVAHARERRQFGRPIGKNQAVSHRVADMKLRLESARWLVYHACWQLDQGLDATVAVSLAKLAASEAAVQSGIDAIRVFGGQGALADGGVAGGLLDALPATAFSGTSDMQREIVARRLGL